MRKVLISLLLASAALSPALAQRPDDSDREAARAERQQAREDRQSAREERAAPVQHEQASRPDRSEPRNVESANPKAADTLRQRQQIQAERLQRVEQRND